MCHITTVLLFSIKQDSALTALYWFAMPETVRLLLVFFFLLFWIWASSLDMLELIICLPWCSLYLISSYRYHSTFHPEDPNHPSLPFLLITHIQYATYVHNLLMFHNEQLCAENATALHITVIWCKLIQTSSDISSEYKSPYSMQHVFRVLQFN